MAACQRASVAIAPSKGRHTRAATAGVFCSLAAVLVLVPFQSVAQTVFYKPLVPSILSQQLGQTILPQQSTLLTRPLPQSSGPTPLVGPAPPPPPPFLLSGAVDLSEGYTTNPSDSSGTNKGDSFTRGQLDLGFHYDSLRIKADAHGSVAGYYYGRTHDNDQVSTQLNLTSQAEIVPDHVFLNVNSFATPVALTRVGQLSAIPGSVSGSNNRQTYGYIANPVFRTRLGDIAFSETSISESQFFVSPSSASSTDAALGITPAGNSTSSSVTERITSAPSFGRIKWGLTGAYSNMNQTSQTEKETVAAVDFGYAFTRSITALAAIGYDEFQASVPLTQSLPAPVALGGVQYSYGPTLNLVVAAGVAHGFTTYLGSLNWDATATFKVVGSLTDAITTPQADILTNLSTLAASTQGVFSTAQSYYWQSGASALNSQFATASPVAQYGLALDNSISRDRTAQLAFLHTDERNQYGLSIFGDQRDRLSVNPDIPSRSSLYGAQVSASRKLRRDLTGFASVSYSYANEFGGNDKIITANAGLSYMMSEKLECYITGNYLQRQSNGQTVTTQSSSSDAVVIVGVRRKL